jgi:hypothetical protein
MIKSNYHGLKHNMKRGFCCVVDLFVPHDGTGLWIIKTETLEEAINIVNTSPRVRDGMLADSARVVEWNAHLGRERFDFNR